MAAQFRYYPRASFLCQRYWTLLPLLNFRKIPTTWLLFLKQKPVKNIHEISKHLGRFLKKRLAQLRPARIFSFDRKDVDDVDGIPQDEDCR